jgi:hypothetical protein
MPRKECVKVTSFFPAANCHADTFQRLTRDLSALIKDPVPGVFALPDPNSLLQVDIFVDFVSSNFSL